MTRDEWASFLAGHPEVDEFRNATLNRPRADETNHQPATDPPAATQGADSTKWQRGIAPFATSVRSHPAQHGGAVTEVSLPHEALDTLSQLLAHSAACTDPNCDATEMVLTWVGSILSVSLLARRGGEAA